MRVLAVAESDAYLKWAAWTLERLPADWDVELVVARSTSSPSIEQVDAALVGTRWRRRDGRARQAVVQRDVVERDVGGWRLARHVRSRRPDVVLLACAGPTAALCSVIVRAAAPGATIATGISGIALPVRRRAIDARRWTDVFIVHSRRERELFAAAFRDAGLTTRVAMSTLPFLRHAAIAPAGTRRIVFAPQPSVPESRAERLALLRRLAGLGPPSPIVKVRADDRGARQTHHEPYPYRELWDELVASGVDAGLLEFRSGPMFDALADASALVTVSSTAALEAIAIGVPVSIIDDFGVSAELLNDVFVGSGLIGKLGVHVPLGPDTAWADRNYFHPGDADDLAAQLSAGRVTGRPGRLPPRTSVTSVLRGALRLTGIDRR